MEDVSVSYKLKDGSDTMNVRLDRLKDFDPRSRNFAVRDLVGAKKPRSYTWRCRAQLDQGPDGACVGFGVAHELIARPAEVQGITNKYAKEEIYWEAQKIDPWEGGSYPGTTDFYEGTSVLAGAKVAKRKGWIDSYRWAFSFEDLMLGVGYNGPAVVGIGWWGDMFEPDNNGYIHMSGGCYGGHCVLVNSVSVKNKRFTIHNSWGAGWGNNGECYVSFDDMKKLLEDYGEAVFFLKRHNRRR